MKKGTSQTDWIISLAIFLLYLAWFFVFLTPTFTSTETLGSSANTLEQKFRKDSFWSLDSIPLFVESVLELENEVITLDPFHLLWRIEDTQLDEGINFVTSGDKLFFLSNISFNDTNTFWFNYGNMESDIEGRPDFIDANEGGVTIGNMEVEMYDLMIDRINYENIPRIIEQSWYYIDGQSISSFNPDHNFTNKESVAEYIVNLEDKRHETFFFLDNHKIYGYLYGESFNYEMNFKLHNYNDLDSQIESFEFNYSESVCFTPDSNYLDFNSEEQGLYFYFDKSVDLTVCTTGGELYLNITANINNKLHYRIIPHLAGADIVRLNPSLNSYFGTKEVVEGLSTIKLENLELMGYEDLKEEWSINEDFRVVVFDSTLVHLHQGNAQPVFIIGKNSTENQNVKVIEFDTRILERNGDYIPVSVNLAVW